MQSGFRLDVETTYQSRMLQSQFRFDYIDQGITNVG
jgi:hypothetical protein